MAPLLFMISLYSLTAESKIIKWRILQLFPCVGTVQFSHSVMSDSLRPHGLYHARPPCQSPTLRVHPDSCLLSRWCHPTISPLCCPLLLLPSIFPSIRVFSNESALHIGSQRIGVSASTSVLPMNNKDWSLGWIGWISLQSKGLSSVFSNTTVQKHQFFDAQFSL